MKRILIIIVLIVGLCSMRAQEVIEHDSLQVADELARLAREMELADSLARSESFELDSLESEPLLIADTVLCIDSVSVVDSLAVDTLLEVDTVPAVPLNPGILPEGALFRSWCRFAPWKEIPYAISYAMAEMLEVEGCPEVDALHNAVDTIPYDSRFTYAQRDLRLPVVFDTTLPQSQQTTLMTQMAQPSDKQLSVAYNDPFDEQLRYAGFRRDALQAYASHNLASVFMLQAGFNANNPFERRRLDRKQFETTDLVISDAALDLGTMQLDFEPVTFHADKWHRMGSTSFQLTQTALTSNWYKGGDNNVVMSTLDKLSFSRYDESMKTTLDIAFELRLSGYYTAADTINPVRVNDNQFRVDVSYGYKAWKKIYYSASFYAQTPILDFHAANSKVTKSTFLSPLETNWGIGAEYKHTSQNKRFSLNVMYAPLSYTIKMVCSHRVDETSYGLKSGETTKHQLGSSLTSKLSWKITDMVSWTSRLYYFTTYKTVQFEFENDFNFQLGKYCSARFYYYPRLDDTRDNRFECKEILTFGLSWVW